MKIKSFKLFESPNSIYIEGETIEFDQDYNAPFSYYRNLEGDYEFAIVDPMVDNEFIHNDLLETWISQKTGSKYVYSYLYGGVNNDNKELSDKIEKLLNLNEVRGYLAGRIFTSQKVITFWKFPKDKEELKKVVKDIELELGYDIWNNPNWKVEILNDEDKNFDKGEYDNWMPSKDPRIEYIPLKEYKGSADRSEEEMKQQHIISPLNKKTKVPSGVGSKNIKNWKEWQKPFEKKIIHH